MWNQSNLEKSAVLKTTMGGAFNFTGFNKLEKNSFNFNNILAKTVSFILEFNSTNSLHLTPTWKLSDFIKNLS